MVMVTGSRFAGLEANSFQSCRSLVDVCPCLVPVILLWTTQVIRNGIGSHGPFVVVIWPFLR